MIPDINHNGPDARDYYDDLGGAYFFRPPGLNTPVRGIGCWGKVIDIIVFIIIMLVLTWVF